MTGQENSWPEKVKTIPQQNLITNLLQSSVFSKKEFKIYYLLNRNKVKTSYDANILIDVLLKTIKFRKRFYGSRQRAHLRCDVCGSRKDVSRLYSEMFGTQVLICLKCEEKREGFRDYLEDIKEKNSESLQKEKEESTTLIPLASNDNDN